MDKLTGGLPVKHRMFVALGVYSVVNVPVKPLAQKVGFEVGSVCCLLGEGENCFSFCCCHLDLFGVCCGWALCPTNELIFTYQIKHRKYYFNIVLKIF